MHLSAATATCSSGTGGVKSDHPAPPLEQPQGTPRLLGLPPESSRPSRKRPAAHQDPGHGLTSSPPPPPPPPLPQYYQLPPQGQILAQNYIPLLTGVRQGELQEGVGLLPSMYADFMKGYEKPPKGRRAPREDLTTFTAEEKLERRKARARIYSDIARKRQEAINDRLKRDVVYMRCFRDLVEQAPCLMAELAPDLEARVLFANAAFDRLLRLPAASVLGSSLWEWIHGDDDRARLQAAFTTVILTKAARVPVVRCRMRRDRRAMGAGAGAGLDAVGVEVAFRRGTQGIMCTLWVD